MGTSALMTSMCSVLLWIDIGSNSEVATNQQNRRMSVVETKTK